MRRAGTSMSLLWGVWVTVLITGYLASRASVFGGGAQNNCINCSDCLSMKLVWISTLGDNGYCGTVFQGGVTPAYDAYKGPNIIPGNPVLYGFDLCFSDWYFSGETVEFVGFNSGTPCDWGVGPPAPSPYECSSVQGITPTGNLSAQQICADPQ